MLRKFAVVMAVLLLGVSVVAAQDDRTVFWQRWDVLINNIDTTNNQFRVTEIYDVQFNGTFHYGSAVIPVASRRPTPRCIRRPFHLRCRARALRIARAIRAISPTRNKIRA